MPFDAAMAHFRLAYRAEVDSAEATRRKDMVTEHLDRLEMAEPLGWTIQSVVHLDGFTQWGSGVQQGLHCMTRFIRRSSPLVRIPL